MFKKVLNSETKESTEEIFRLEMICESVTEKVLEYVCPRYTTQTSEPARELTQAKNNSEMAVGSLLLGGTRESRQTQLKSNAWISLRHKHKHKHKSNEDAHNTSRGHA